MDNLFINWACKVLFDLLEAKQLSIAITKSKTGSYLHEFLKNSLKNSYKSLRAL